MHNIHSIAILSLTVAGLCSIIIVIDILAGNRQKMIIMNFVYPLSGLYGSVLALLFYFKIGRKSAITKMNSIHKEDGMQSDKRPFYQSVAIAALHCGSGCTLGDILAETFLVFVPVILFGSHLVGTWTIDFAFAFVIGIVFQYYSIKPMRKMSSKGAFIAALKADTLSLTAWQIGMYGWMAITIFLIFKHRLDTANPVFWFMMQIAMLLGFVTAYPVNWLLIKKGIKEEM